MLTDLIVAGLHLSSRGLELAVSSKPRHSLANFYAVTHPSEANYCAVVAGDYFGMDNDDFNTLPANISTIVDLLDTKGISWGEYQEDIPYAGFQGFNFSNQKPLPTTTSANITRLSCSIL